MIAVCKKTDAKDFDLTFVTTIFYNDFDYSHGWGLELHKKYIIMGMAIYFDSKCLYYLIDTNGHGSWFPYLLFDVVDNHIPKEWFTKVTRKDENSQILYLWEFDELCNDPDFYDDLGDLDEKALRTYFRRKIEYEKESGFEEIF